MMRALYFPLIFIAYLVHITLLNAQDINHIQDFSADVIYDSLTATYKVIEEGRAILSVDIAANQYEARHRNAEVGKFIRVVNPNNGQFVVVRNIAPLPEKDQKDGVLIQLSQKAYDKLGFEGFAKFEVELKYTTKLSRELIETLLSIQKSQNTLEKEKENVQKDKLEQQRERLNQQGQLVAQWQQYFYILIIVSSILLLWGLLQNQKKRQYRLKAQDYDLAKQRADNLARARRNQLDMIYENLKMPLSILQDNLPSAPPQKVMSTSTALQQIFSTLSQLNLLEDYQMQDLQLNKSTHTFNHTVEQVITQVEPLLASKNVEFINLIAEDFTATYDAQLIKQVLEQLIIYALSRSPDEDIITLKVQNNGKQYIISLNYQDPKLSPELFAQDLELINNLDARSLLQEGRSPLALAFAKMILEAHQNSLQVRFHQNGVQVLFFDLKS